jgi:4-amino-4-deoxy-L-arabinose transferase-like glycosyltransferase
VEAVLWRSLGGTLRRIPTTAWVCALIACLNAVAWSVVSPPFQVPDEAAHYAYVQRLAETGHLPTSPGENYPLAEERALYDLHTAEVLEHPAVHTIASEAAQRKLERDLATPETRTGSPDAGVATTQPPLYYALETIPYGLASGGTVLDRLALMRLLSALMGGLTALFGYLFLREALPGAPWAWTVGGLGVALTPLLGLMSGAVNPDALLCAVSAALFYCLARGFRQGIAPRLAIAIGVVLAVGFLTKLTFLCLLPGAILGLLALCARVAYADRTGDSRLGRVAGGSGRRTALRCLALALAVGASPCLLYLLVNALSGRPTLGAIAGVFAPNSKSGSLLKELSYIWQYYLPRLPGMKADFHGLLTTRTYWFDGIVGIYGWVDTRFPNWVYDAALIPAGLIAVLFAHALLRFRSVLRSRLVEVLVYVAMSLGVLLTVGADDYLHKVPGEYAEPRYLLPMLVLWGAVLALAARGAGRRWGPVAGALIVTLVLAQNIFGQLLDVARYYG